MGVKLIKLTEKYKTQLCEMIDEWKKDQQANGTNRSPWAIFKNDPHDFDFYLKNLENDTPTKDKVPDSVFFLLDEQKDRLLGAVNIRHYLNDALLKTGGHIGDGIRPSERRKGYATEIIRLALIECEKLGIKKVLITCDKANIGSVKSIVKNGGILENEIEGPDGEIIQRYWISLKMTANKKFEEEKTEHKIKTMAGFKVIGFQKVFDSKTAYSEIPRFWDEVFGEDAYEKTIIENKIGEFGVCIDDVGKGKFRYMIAGRYSRGEIPDGMEVYEFPKGEWAVFDCFGSLPDALQTVNTRIFKEWLPKNPNYEIYGNATAEWYDQVGEKDDANYHSAIWIHVKRK